MLPNYKHRLKKRGLNQLGFKPLFILTINIYFVVNLVKRMYFIFFFLYFGGKERRKQKQKKKETPNCFLYPHLHSGIFNRAGKPAHKRFCEAKHIIMPEGHCRRLRVFLSWVTFFLFASQPKRKNVTGYAIYIKYNKIYKSCNKRAEILLKFRLFYIKSPPYTEVSCFI